MTDFAAVFENLLYPCCVVDENGYVRAWNAAMQALTHISDAGGKPLDTLGIIPQALHSRWLSARTNQAASHVTFKLDKQVYYVLFTPLQDASWLIQVDASEEKNDLLYVVLHDLQNPLAAIKGYAELIENVGELSDKQQHYLGRVYIAVEDITELASHLLDVAWIDSGIPIDSKPLNFAHLVYNLASVFHTRAENKGIDFKLDINPVPPVLCDERRMKQVINNLIGNAIKYSLNGGEVVVSVKQVAQGVEFSVSDQGIGIPPEHIDKIFQRFFRVPGDHIATIQGNGLGLSICYDILKKHGSALQVDSTPGEGSRFYFVLPLAEKS